MAAYDFYIVVFEGEILKSNGDDSSFATPNNPSFFYAFVHMLNLLYS